MAIIQISKIQQRSGNIVDLPQLDEAEFGWATDVKKLYIGKTTPNENIEVLTSYSNISFSQLNGSFGNLSIDSSTIANGQPLVYTGSEWTNRGGNVGGLINLGDVANVKIGGGATSYVLETDGTGNLNWAPKSSIIGYIENITKASSAVVTTTTDNYFVNGAEITITGVKGMTALNGNTYYVDVLSSNSFILCSDVSLTPVNTTSYPAFPNTEVTEIDYLSRLVVTSSDAFTKDDEVKFTGDVFGGLKADVPYYVIDKDSNIPGTWITVSLSLDGAPILLPASTPTGTNPCYVYATGGRAVSLVSGGGGGGGSGQAGGTNTMVQFNNLNTLEGSSDFTFNNNSTFGPKTLTVNGNVNTGNLNATGAVKGAQLISTTATGTAPLSVTSTTRVGNLNVAYANVADFINISTVSSGTQYIVVASGSSGNVSEGAHVGLTFNSSTGNLETPLLSVTGNANIANLGVSGIIFSDRIAVTGNANVGNINATGFAVIAGNVTGGNLSTGGRLTVTGNANVGNLGVGGVITATGTVTGGNLATGGAITATGNVSAGNVSVPVGSVLTTQLTTGANITAGAITGNWTLTTGSRFNATYADLAEYYNADQQYEPGTVLEFGGDNEVTVATDGTTRVAGVVSTDPAYAMNAKCPGEHPLPLALQGRVPTKVRGTIRKGDMMVSAGDGYARPSINPQVGSVIGKALENFDGVEGVIEVAVGRL